MRISGAPLVLGIAGAAAGSAVVKRAVDLESCPGYVVGNVKEGSGGLTAELRMEGTPCDVYGRDLRDLKVEVEFQTGGLFPLSLSLFLSLNICVCMYCGYILTLPRNPPPRQNLRRR